MSEPQMALECENALDNLGSRSNKATPNTVLTSLPWLSVVHLCAWFALFSRGFFLVTACGKHLKFLLEGTVFTQSTFLKQLFCP